jgi:Lrp/AsnC family leucine-responsive transcriptional regulator
MGLGPDKPGRRRATIARQPDMEGIRSVATNSNARPDAIDEQILEELRHEPRATSKALGLKLSMTEVAVASRIRAMEAKGFMRVVAQLEFRAAGYNILALMDIMVADRRINEVAEALSRIDRIGSVTMMLGDPPIIVQVQAADQADLHDLIVNHIAIIPGVEQVETNLIIDIAKWRPGSGHLHMPSLLG